MPSTTEADSLPAQMLSWLQALIAPDQIVELRALRVPSRPGRPPHTQSGFFDYEHLADMVREAQRLTILRPSGIYWTLNPLTPDIIARKANRCEYARPSTLAHDADVIRRRWFLIDCDPIRLADVSSTAEERGAALDVATHIIEYLSSLGWPTPVFADSGNGAHILYRVDLPAADGDLIKRCLAAIADRFKSPAVSIDKVNFNPSRICKLYGTISRKGDNITQRPHRYSRVVGLPDQILAVGEDLLRELAAQAPAEVSRGRSQAKPVEERHSTDPESVISRARAYLAHVPPAVAGQHGHNATFRAAMVLVEGFLLDASTALPLLQDWNSTCQPPWADHELAHKLADAEKKRGPNAGYLLNSNHSHPGEIDFSNTVLDPELFGEPPAEDDGFGPSPAPPAQQPGGLSPRLAEDEKDPDRLARVFLQAHFTDQQTSARTLIFWRQEWFAWDGAAYHVIDAQSIEAAINRSCKAEADRICLEKLAGGGAGRDINGNIPVPFPITTSLCNNVRKVVEAICSCRVPWAPAWLTDSNEIDGNEDLPPANELLSTKSAVLHLPQLDFVPRTPRLLNLNSLEMEHDPQAHCPAWIHFLNTIWPNDLDSVETLQEWFGYLLLPDTSQHKLLMLKGPTRSGKGTIGRVMKKLIGEKNFTSPTLSSLSNPYGLWPLLGKTAALISDARLSGRVDSQVVIERLLSITGEDPQDVDRKFLPTISGIRLPVRFTIMTNELPNLADASGAIVRRMLLLEMTESFLGREDRKLDAKLSGELPGILNWAIEGWYRLRDRGHFVQTESGRMLLAEMEEIASPVTSFLAECCILERPLKVECGELYKAWCEWCKREGRLPGARALFGRQLFAATSAIRKKRLQDGYFYQGVTLRPIATVDGF